MRFYVATSVGANLKSTGLHAPRGNEVYAAHTARARKSRERLFRARAVCEAYTSFPRGSMKSCGLQICSDRSGNVDAHPRGAFYVIGISYHIKFFGDVSQFCFLDRYKNIQTERYGL